LDNLSAGSPDVFCGAMARFRQSLQEARFVEGRNVAIEYRWLAISPPPPKGEKN
jgi:hypothetical protein